eukprot:8593320-Prorocentrum_lima.AAC.1
MHAALIAEALCRVTDDSHYAYFAKDPSIPLPCFWARIAEATTHQGACGRLPRRDGKGLLGVK